MKFILKESEKIAKLVDKLSVKELLEQIVCPSYYFEDDDKRLKEVGAVYMHKKSREEIKKRMKNLNNKNNIPAFVMSDMECGAGAMIDGATEFTTMMGVSQTNSEELAYELGKIAAGEAVEMGYNWTLAPVVDLAFNPDSPVVGTRSAGIDSQQVKKITNAYMKGLQDNGLVATAKHFPGDGFSTYDQHLTTSKNPLSLSEWYEYSGKAFKDIIDAGIISVMPGHISLPAYDDIDEKTGVCPPATFSKKLLKNLLRDDLGFRGIIISDAINMGGAVGYMEYYKACATFFESGGDCLLFPIINDEFWNKMIEMIDNGFLSLTVVKNRAYRMLCLKEQLGMFDRKENQKVNLEHNDKINEEITKKAITIVKDKQKILPYNIKKDTKVLQLVIMNDYDTHKPKIDSIFEELKKYSDNVVQLIDPGPDKLVEICNNKEYDLIICLVGNCLSWGTNVVRMHGPVARNMMGGWMKLGIPVIFISLFHPYIHKEYEVSIETLINTYGYNKYTSQYLLKGILGEFEMNKTLFAHN